MAKTLVCYKYKKLGFKAMLNIDRIGDANLTSASRREKPLA
jgi:hypothetical protein